MKRFCLFLMVLILSCEFISIGIVQAQTEPSVPEFTAKLVDNSYNVPPTQSTDPYTGKTVTQPGYHVKKIEVELKIKNQPSQSKIIYNIRYKGHYDQEWKEVFTYPYLTRCPEMTNGQYTTIPFTVDYYSPYRGAEDVGITVPDGGQVDFQVEAWSGTFSFQQDPWGEMTGQGRGYDVFDGVSSGWSKTQTITINKNNNEVPNQAPDNTETPTNPNQPINLTNINLLTITIITITITITITLL
ncbi:MAG: hypothetical protein FWH37_00540, partial [Candidatus Bathyarchaeota archaeon]|nr:hypothetical protein [Candidatus Termiticorpusculum sp.]